MHPFCNGNTKRPARSATFIFKIEKSLQKSLQWNVKTGLILKVAESCALYNTLNKGYIVILLIFFKIVSSPAKRVGGETSTPGSNPGLSAILNKKPRWIRSMWLFFICPSGLPSLLLEQQLLFFTADRLSLDTQIAKSYFTDCYELP